VKSTGNLPKVGRRKLIWKKGKQTRLAGLPGFIGRGQGRKIECQKKNSRVLVYKTIGEKSVKGGEERKNPRKSRPKGEEKFKGDSSKIFTKERKNPKRQIKERVFKGESQEKKGTRAGVDGIGENGGGHGELSIFLRLVRVSKPYKRKKETPGGRTGGEKGAGGQRSRPQEFGGAANRPDPVAKKKGPGLSTGKRGVFVKKKKELGEMAGIGLCIRGWAPRSKKKKGR